MRVDGFAQIPVVPVAGITDLVNGVGEGVEQYGSVDGVLATVCRKVYGCAANVHRRVLERGSERSECRAEPAVSAMLILFCQ